MSGYNKILKNIYKSHTQATEKRKRKLKKDAPAKRKKNRRERTNIYK